MSAHTPGDWRTGREDMQSYDAYTGEPFASIYADDSDPRMHLGEPLPLLIAHTFGPDCKALAAQIVRACNAHEDLMTVLHEARALVAALACSMITHDRVYRPLVDRIDAAIAKAEGGPR